MKWALSKQHVRKGFTIVELIIVIVVIGILATLVVVGYSGAVNSANDTSVKSDLKKIDDAMKQYALDNGGVYPTTSAQMSTIGVTLSSSSYRTTNAANLVVCLNPTSTEYAVVAMSSSGNRFVGASEGGVSPYTGTVVWDEATGNWDATCASVDADYDSPSDLSGMIGSNWLPWTGVVGAGQHLANYVTNPSIEVSTSNLTLNDVSAMQSSAWAASGVSSVLLTPTATNNSFIAPGGDVGAMRLAMVPGGTYTASGTLRLSAAQTGTLHAQARTIAFIYKVGTQPVVTTLSAQASNSAGETRLSVTVTLPHDATQAYVRYYNGASLGNGTVAWDSLMISDGKTLYDYYDGNSTNWAWQGAPGLSASSGATQ